MATKSGELRETLIECIEKVKAGTMPANDAKAIALLAAAVTAMLQVEANVRHAGYEEQMGALSLGEQQAALSHKP